MPGMLDTYTASCGQVPPHHAHQTCTGSGCRDQRTSHRLVYKSAAVRQISCRYVSAGEPPHPLDLCMHAQMTQPDADCRPTSGGTARKLPAGELPT